MMKRRPLLLMSLCNCLLLAAPAAADNPLVPARATSQQQQIKVQTQQVKDEIGAIIAEYQSNGLGASEDVAMLKSIQDALDSLSREQMSDVLRLLAAARAEPDPAAARTALFAAIREQGDIALRLQQQLLQSQRQQDFASIALRFNQLADRQHANLRMLRRYSRLAGGATAFTLTLPQKEYLQTQVTEQENIAEEVRQQLDRLADLTRNADPQTAQRLGAMQQDSAAARLPERLQAAGDVLANSQVGLAAIEERAIRDALRRMVRLGTPALDSYQSLRSAGDRIARMVQQQRAIVVIVGDPAKAGVPADPAADTAAQIEEQQADIVDDADEVAQELAAVDPEVARLLSRAILEMQYARKGILAHAQQETVARATQARDSLEAALARIAVTLGRLEKLASATQLSERVLALQECVAALRQDEERLAADSASPNAAVMGDLSLRQAALAHFARDLLPFAGQMVADVPLLLGDAADHMDAAAGALGNLGDAAQAQAGESAAIASMRKAESLLQARAGQLAQAQNDLGDLERARQRLVWAITQQERVAVAVAERDAVTAAAATQASTGPSAADLANREGTLRTAVAGIQRLLGGRVAAAHAALSAAQEHLGGASAALAKSDAHAALPVSRQALADLDAARRALDPRLADLRQTLELPDHPASALDALAQSIQQITRDLRTPPDPARQAAVALRDQERQIAAEMRELAPQNAPLQNAAGAADQAADRMDRNQLLDAARQAQAALDLMKTAADFALQLSGITARQAEITQSLQRMLTQAATQAAPATAPEQPLDALPVSAAQAAQLAGDATYTQAQDRGAIPPTASQALATAEQALAEASAQAAAGNQPAAQAARHRALAALEQAQSVVAAAQSAQNALAAQPPKPNQPGPPQPGKNTQPGPTPPKPDQPPGPGQTLQGDPRDEHNQTVNITVSPVTGGTATFIQLPPRDRAAIEQSRHDPYPQEYAPLIENYFKNLSEQRE